MAKSEFAAKQWQEVKNTGGTPMVTCSCGQKIPLRFAYKCYYCDEYFCYVCAAIHFGKTREQYEKEKETCLAIGKRF